MTIKSVVIAVLSDFAHTYISQAVNILCMIEFEWKYVNVMH